MAGIIFAVAAAYWNSLRAPFLFDDTGAVLNNPTIRRLASWEAFTPPSDGSTTTGRPLVNFSFALNYAVGGENVWGYHALNVAIHAFAALTLMGLVRRTLLGPQLREQWGGAAPPVALAVALLWALHPLQTESVVCIAQRTESLCSLFYLLTLYGFVRATDENDDSARRASRIWFAVAVASCLCGMATKEVMVTAPLIVLLYDRTFGAGNFSTALRQRRGFYAALAATWLLLAFLLWRSGGARGAAAGFGLGVSWWTYLLKQCEALGLYLKLSVWPNPLVLDYGTAVARSLSEVWWQGVLVVTLLGATGWALVRRPVAGFLGAWFFLILAPSSSVVPLITQTMAEHRMYLPLAAIVGLAVTTLHRRLGPRFIWPCGALALAFLALVVARNRDYRDTVIIWQDNVSKRPAVARGHNNLAWALQQRGRSAQANESFARAVALEPGYITAHYSWGVALLDQQRIPEAIAQFEQAVALAPNHADAHVNLGNALMQVRRAADAIPHYETALRLSPGLDAHYNLGVALLELGRAEEAQQHLSAALRLSPQRADTQAQLGRATELSGRLAEAESHYAEALRLAPDHVLAHRRLGLLLARSDRLEPAAEHFRAVVRLQPDDADAHANLGNISLLRGQAREAITHYQEALRLRPNDPRTRDSLEAARDALR